MEIVFDLCNKNRAGQKQWGVGVRLVMQGSGDGDGAKGWGWFGHHRQGTQGKAEG